MPSSALLFYLSLPRLWYQFYCVSTSGQVLYPGICTTLLHMLLEEVKIIPLLTKHKHINGGRAFENVNGYLPCKQEFVLGNCIKKN